MQIHRKEISPTLATWLIFLVGASLSLATYAVAAHGDFKSGILNTIDVLVALTITLAILRWGSKTVRLKPFEKKYLIAAAIIVVFWIVTKSAFTANLLLQVLMSVAFLPTIQNLITEKRNTESFSAWSLVFVASSLALYPALHGGNVLAVIYAARSAAITSTVLCLMAWYTWRARVAYIARH